MFIRPTASASKFVRCFSASATRANLNKVQLIGRVGADPTVTEVGDLRVVNYTVATSEVRPDNEGNLIKKTQWHRISSWKSADWLPNKVKKGDLVYVEGQLRYKEFTDKEGVNRVKAEISQSSFRLLATSGNNEEVSEE
ncbi:uncharacterized protein BYT42DRAFT_645895 [Radiomyces spectabilis]|uniref:uncharacterized protein n=1 Tax=Radiomyces spectabilis TaxID=64574 RepID=UPI00221E4603|nr:uncharacterized protein BYT42DRAFT_645895 [Radiomyces spectabilis]KAI8376259.1 hypothetical protein BYT42DRAFT_645895 [Radiomyces spectabilis]